MGKKRMGRPPKEPADQASEIIAIRLTPAERELLERLALRARLKLSAWMRDRLMKAAKRESGRE